MKEHFIEQLARFRHPAGKSNRWRQGAMAGTHNWPLKKCRGMTLLEVAIGSFLFALMAVSILTAMVQSRKISENNIAQATAAMVAQGIIEQIQVLGYVPLTTNASLQLNFSGPDSSNQLVVQNEDLPWASDATTFTSLGSHADPNDSTSAIVGVLIDMPYLSGSTVIRPAKYMKMAFNLRRNANTNNDNVEIVLTYRWQPPSGNGAISSRYITREIRTIRSTALSY